MQIIDLEPAPAQRDEPPQKQLAPFYDFEEQARRLVIDAEAIAKLEPTAANAKVARTMRLEIRPFRTSIERRHAELKRPVLDEGARLDDAKNALIELLKPIESKLLAIEQHAEREAARLLDELRTARVAEITPFLNGPVAVDLGVMPDAEYAAMLDDVRVAHAERVAREAKAKVDALAAIEADKAAREAQRIENERLRAQVAERDAAAQAEREAAAAQLAAAQAAQKAERDARIAADAEVARVKSAELAEQSRVKAAEKKAAAAPDAAKLTAFAASIRALAVPAVRQDVAQVLAQQVEEFASWVEGKAGEL